MGFPENLKLRFAARSKQVNWMLSPLLKNFQPCTSLYMPIVQKLWNQTTSLKGKVPSMKVLQ